MLEEYFLRYFNDEVFVISIGYSEDKMYFYYPKGDVILVVKNSGEISVEEIEEIYGLALSGMRLRDSNHSWENIKNREVIWYINGKEVHSDNVYVVLRSDDDYRVIESSSPNRLKYYIFKDQDPWVYENWCCVLIASTKDVESLPPTFKKVKLSNL